MGEPSAKEIDKEVLPFLSLAAKPHLRTVAMQFFLGLTGRYEGLQFIAANDKYITAIVNVLEDEQQAISKDAYLTLVNLTTNEPIAWKLLHLEMHNDLLFELLKYCIQPDSQHADIACMVLSNLSRIERCAKLVVDLMIQKKEQVGFDKLIHTFCTVNFNKNANYNYIGPFLSNLTQTKEARHYVLDKERCVVQKLLSYTQYKESLIRRGGIIGTLKNCCFETEYHEWLLSDKVDILPRLLLPLAGPEEFDEDDMDKLPEDLQYLQPDKERERDPDIRKMLVEAIHQLLATKHGRDYIRKKNAYVILRELDKWETDPACQLVVQNTVSILIADDPEAGMENLQDVAIPENVESKLCEADEKQQQEIEEEMKKLQIDEGSKDG